MPETIPHQASTVQVSAANLLGAPGTTPGNSRSWGAFRARKDRLKGRKNPWQTWENMEKYRKIWEHMETHGTHIRNYRKNNRNIMKFWAKPWETTMNVEETT